MMFSIGFFQGSQVAPRAGAWIETNGASVYAGSSLSSPPARGRGLKQNNAVVDKLDVRRPPRGGVD